MKRSLITDPSGEALAWLVSVSEECLGGSAGVLLDAVLNSANGDLSVTLPDGSLLVFPANQVLDVWRNIIHVYCLDDYRFKSLNPEGAYLVDIGSYIGVSVLRLASMFPGTPIIAVEPNPLSARYLSLNIEANGLANRVKLVRAALWVQRGIATLHVPRDWVNASIDGAYATSLGGHLVETIQVQTLTLGDLLREERAALVKIDIEGAERQVVEREAGRTLEPSRGHTVVIEFHDPIIALEARKLLGKVGYTCSIHSLGGTVQHILACRPA